MTAALEAAETGKQVVLVEKNPYLGGRTVQL
jgi:quinone-modifying oxidoreductase subunit QmoA